MILTLIISISVFVLVTLSVLFFPSFSIKGHKIGTYWIIALIGAALLLATLCLPIEEFWKGLTSSSAVNPLKILILFFSMTVLSVYLDECGLFRYLAKLAVRLSGKSQFLLLGVIYALAAILTVFTSNDVVILTLTPFIVFFAKHTKINPIPYLVAEFVAANTWSMMLLIGNPTNVYLGTSAGIDFTSYFRVMALPTLAAGVLEIGLVYLLFFRHLKEEIVPEEDDFKIESKADLIIGLIHLGLCLGFLIASSYLSFEMWLVALIAASSLVLTSTIYHLLDHKHWSYLAHTAERLPYQLIPFVISMFVIVASLQYQGVASKIGEWLSNTHPIWGYGLSSFLVANLVNNIPMSVLFSVLPVGMPEPSYLQAIYASIIGSNIGAFLTPVGALAGIMFSSLLAQYDIHYGFKEFVRYGFLIALPVILISLAVLQLVLQV